MSVLKGIHVRTKGLIAAAASLAFMAAPTIAPAQQAARAAATEVSPAGEHVGGSQLHGDYILPLVGLTVLLLIIILVADDHHHHNDLPHSP
jgi:hypothetical protein